jgi:hypothetical protein
MLSPSSTSHPPLDGAVALRADTFSVRDERLEPLFHQALHSSKKPSFSFATFLPASDCAKRLRRIGPKARPIEN